MRTPCRSTLCFLLLAMTAAWPAQTAAQALHNVPQLSPPADTQFLCDSLWARDCFEMFQRSNAGITTVPKTPDGAISDDLDESLACALNLPHRGDRCRARSTR